MRFRITPHLSFMVQWLRVLGFDVRLWKKGELLDPREEALIQWARYPLPRRPFDPPVITLAAVSLPQLLQEFLEKVGPREPSEKLFGRCLRCNTPLDTLTPEETKSLWPDLPEYVYRTQKRFTRCPTCGRFFWKGTHVDRMRRTLREWGVLPEEGAEEEADFFFDEPVKKG